MIIDILQPAVSAADRITLLGDKLKRNIDSLRRGHDVDPWTIAEEMAAELKGLKKVQKAVARAA